ncbi:restriction endonuclease subunit S [Butyrivibrio sp. XPD2006]|uniref:restriction endonuclease subunit S n=1 Tax=Butyrivibrio sp. XPD2006 TaxID=1280668 RepID=UPI0003FF897D|nr:restriction endonuclease subunit S [Butyrivibrio sp. XPD2006]
MEKILLEDCCEILDSMRVPITSSDRVEGPYPYYGANGIQDHVAEYIFDDELVLLAEDGGNFGSKERSIAYRVSGKCWVNNHAHVLKPKDGLDVDYLCYSLMFYDVGGMVNGATRQKLTQAAMRQMLIPKRSITEQQYIVKLLGKVVSIKEERKHQLEELDNLIKARFVELFGDLEKNDKGWDERPLLDVCNQLKRYPTFCNMDYLEQGTRVIRIGNILLDGHMDADDNNYVFVYDTVNEDFPDTVISINDIVMAVRGDGSAAKRIGIIQEEKLVGANISPNLIRIQANSGVVAPLFLFHYLISEVGQKRLDSYVNKTAKKNIAAKDIAKVKTPVPEMRLQNEYVEFVKQVDKSKVVVQKSLDETQKLFDSLMQEYFG